MMIFLNIGTVGDEEFVSTKTSPPVSRQNADSLSYNQSYVSSEFSYESPEMEIIVGDCLPSRDTLNLSLSRSLVGGRLSTSDIEINTPSQPSLEVELERERDPSV